LFIAVDGGLGGLEGMRRPGFYFDKTKHVPLPADKVEFAAMVRGAVVARDDRVSAMAKR